uniref:Uncharacterized protein n=1 Tax=Timema shepardi TaxID=629360 RepID=A0A7R9FYF0_TIMSH|nr:unnamed protein product [Timema shepardi]
MGSMFQENKRRIPLAHCSRIEERALLMEPQGVLAVYMQIPTGVCKLVTHRVMWERGDKCRDNRQGVLPTQRVSLHTGRLGHFGNVASPRLSHARRPPPQGNLISFALASPRQGNCICFGSGPPLQGNHISFGLGPPLQGNRISFGLGPPPQGNLISLDLASPLQGNHISFGSGPPLQGNLTSFSLRPPLQGNHISFALASPRQGNRISFGLGSPLQGNRISFGLGPPPQGNHISFGLGPPPQGNLISFGLGPPPQGNLISFGLGPPPQGNHISFGLGPPLQGNRISFCLGPPPQGNRFHLSGVVSTPRSNSPSSAAYNSEPDKKYKVSVSFDSYESSGFRQCDFVIGKTHCPGEGVPRSMTLFTSSQFQGHDLFLSRLVLSSRQTGARYESSVLRQCDDVIGKIHCRGKVARVNDLMYLLKVSRSRSIPVLSRQTGARENPLQHHSRSRTILVLTSLVDPPNWCHEVKGSTTESYDREPLSILRHAAVRRASCSMFPLMTREERPTPWTAC